MHAELMDKKKCEWPIYTGQKAQRSGFLSERRNNGMDEGWAAKQTGTRDMKFVTTMELSAQTCACGTSKVPSPTMRHGENPAL